MWVSHLISVSSYRRCGAWFNSPFLDYLSCHLQRLSTSQKKDINPQIVGALIVIKTITNFTDEQQTAKQNAKYLNQAAYINPLKVECSRGLNYFLEAAWLNPWGDHSYIVDITSRLQFKSKASLNVASQQKQDKSLKWLIKQISFINIHRHIM